MFNKLNEKGQKMILYKKELLNKSNSEIVIDSLLSVIDNLASQELINVNIYQLLKDNNVDESSFLEVIKEDISMLKTKDEIIKEYYKIKDFLLEKDSKLDIEVIVDSENDTINILKEFKIEESFIRNYFLIEDEISYNSLIKRKGFIEKFAILRLNKIFDDFLKVEELESFKDFFTLTKSDVFFDVEKNIYGIYISISFKTYLLEKETDFCLEEKLLNIINLSNNYFKKKIES